MLDKILKCSNCNYKMAEVVVVHSKEELDADGLPCYQSRFKVINCPKCNGESLWSEIFEGQTSVGTLVDELTLDVVDTDVVKISDSVVFVNTLKLITKQI